MRASEHFIPGACCLRCHTAAVMRVRDEEGDVYQKCLACGRHNLRLPAGIPHSPAHDCHRSTARRDFPVPPTTTDTTNPIPAVLRPRATSDTGCAA
jgi:Zn ribbon nucleic-acid-binding protein